jgi:hypothetical protein
MVEQRSIWPVRSMAGAGTARRRSICLADEEHGRGSMEASYASSTALDTIEPLRGGRASRIRRRMCSWGPDAASRRLRLSRRPVPWWTA